MRMLLLAPPGAGKGTQGVRLAEHFGVTHIAAGDLLREEINGQSERGRRARAYVDRGELVPDQVVIDLVTPAAVAAAAAGGFVLDGFPRTTPQALAAADLGLRLGIRFQAVVYLDVPEDELTARPLRRATKQGRTDDTVHRICKELGVAEVLWSVTAKDYTTTDSALITQRVLDQSSRDGIILLHDSQPRTAAMLPAFLRYLRDNHYHVVHIVPTGPAVDFDGVP